MSKKLNPRMRIGFEYTIDHVRDGQVISSEKVKNLVPEEGLNYVVGVALAGFSQLSSWFVGLFEGDYNPTSGATGANIVAAATECTAYTSATRPAWTPGSISVGAVSNTDSKAEFTFNSAKTVYGGYLVSSSTKGGTTGTLLSLVRFSSAKSVESGDVLRITAGLILVSA